MEEDSLARIQLEWFPILYSSCDFGTYPSARESRGSMDGMRRPQFGSPDFFGTI